MNNFQNLLDNELNKIVLAEDSVKEVPVFDIYEEIRKQIIRARKQNKITQKQLSQKAGITQANLSNIENGNIHPSIDTLQKIANTLEKELVIMFKDKEYI